jgi:hypothetical protein
LGLFLRGIARFVVARRATRFFVRRVDLERLDFFVVIFAVPE